MTALSAARSHRSPHRREARLRMLRSSVEIFSLIGLHRTPERATFAYKAKTSPGICSTLQRWSICRIRLGTVYQHRYEFDFGILFFHKERQKMNRKERRVVAGQVCKYISSHFRAIDGPNAATILHLHSVLESYCGFTLLEKLSATSSAWQPNAYSLWRK